MDVIKVDVENCEECQCRIEEICGLHEILGGRLDLERDYEGGVKGFSPPQAPEWCPARTGVKIEIK